MNMDSFRYIARLLKEHRLCKVLAIPIIRAANPPLDLSVAKSDFTRIFVFESSIYHGSPSQFNFVETCTAV